MNKLLPEAFSLPSSGDASLVTAAVTLPLNYIVLFYQTPLVEACQVDGDVFASELVIRAYRAGLRMLEIPVRVLEKRPPSINLLKRIPGVTRNLVQLRRALMRNPA